jgi:hypothetical protein
MVLLKKKKLFFLRQGFALFPILSSNSGLKDPPASDCRIAGTICTYHPVWLVFPEFYKQFCYSTKHLLKKGKKHTLKKEEKGQTSGTNQFSNFTGKRTHVYM